jgi:hypothetical protein
MDTVCPASVVYTGLNQGFLTSANPTLLSGTTMSVIPSYDPTQITAGRPTYKNPVDNQTYTAVLFPIGPVIEGVRANRYNPTFSGNLSQTGYWRPEASAALGDSGANSVYQFFLDNNVPGKDYRVITSQAELTAGLTGTLPQKKISVSYDLLYSLQYEFCYYMKLYRTLLSDYITIQNTAASDTAGATFTTTMKDNLLKAIINTLNATNLRLKDITEVSAIISTKQTDDISKMNTNVNRFLSSITANSNVLKDNAAMLSSKDREARLRSRMIEYSDEKNSYANQLLAMYGFANLIAMGLLFYIYKS